ncbi:MAG: hypothetical protein AB1792_00070 [Candidatus Zixiibacteriota bacterium]
MKNLRWSWAGLVASLLVLVTATSADAQRSSRYRGLSNDENIGNERAPRRMIDNPTAGMLGRGSFDTELRAFPDGGMLGILQIGLTKNWMVGIAYGGTNIIAAHDPQWNPHMQFLTRLQLIGETMALPGLAVGYEDIGFGPWIDSLDRFDIKSKGFYAVVSKAYRGTSFTSSLHGGVNYSRERADKDDDVDFFFGSDLRFDNNIGFVVEYDLGLNDDRKHHSLGKGEGYLNAGARWTVLERVLMEFNLKDILTNRRGSNTIGRELRLIYVESF